MDGRSKSFMLDCRRWWRWLIYGVPQDSVFGHLLFLFTAEFTGGFKGGGQGGRAPCDKSGPQRPEVKLTTQAYCKIMYSNL